MWVHRPYLWPQLTFITVWPSYVGDQISVREDLSSVILSLQAPDVSESLDLMNLTSLYPLFIQLIIIPMSSLNNLNIYFFITAYKNAVSPSDDRWSAPDAGVLRRLCRRRLGRMGGSGLERWGVVASSCSTPSRSLAKFLKTIHIPIPTPRVVFSHEIQAVWFIDPSVLITRPIMRHLCRTAHMKYRGKLYAEHYYWDQLYHCCKYIGGTDFFSM